MKKRRKRFLTLSCDTMMYETEGGEQAALRVGQWINVKKKLSQHDYNILMRYSEAAEADDSHALRVSQEEITDLLARKIVAWNLTDLDADLLLDGEEALLPEPSFEVLDRDLDFVDDLLEIFILYTEAIFPSKN